MFLTQIMWFLGGTVFGLTTMFFVQQWTPSARKLVIRNFEQNVVVASTTGNTAASILQFGHPGPVNDDLKRDEYIANYNRRDRVPNWVAEHLDVTTLTTGTGVNRDKSSFREDPDIPPVFRALLKNYVASGYDRGHQAPAADATFTQKAMDETFLLTNMAPQVGVGFNRAYWAYFEDWVRHLVGPYPDVWVWTGPLFLPQKNNDGNFYIHYQVIGNPPNIAVPTHFYKVILTKRDETYSSAAFVLPNQVIASNVSLNSFKVPLPVIERAAGLTFLTTLNMTAVKDLCVETKCAFGASAAH